MKSVILSLGLIFVLQSQASFLSRILERSGIYESFCWSISDAPLNTYHNTFRTINSETLSTASNTGPNEVERANTNPDELNQTKTAESNVLPLNLTPNSSIFPGNELDSRNENDDFHLSAETTNIMRDSMHEQNKSYSSSETADISNPGKKEHPKKQLIQKKRQTPKPKRNMTILRDLTTSVQDVQPVVTNTQPSEISQDRRVSQVKDQFKAWLYQGKYHKVFKLVKKAISAKFFKLLYSLIRAFLRFTEPLGYAIISRWLAVLFVYGDMKTVREIIIESRAYDDGDCVGNGALEIALPRALKEDNHVRFIELLKVRKEVTEEREERSKRERGTTSFEAFIGSFFRDLAPSEDSMTLKQSLTLNVDELKYKHPEILDVLCQGLVFNLRHRLDEPKAKKLLIDLMGQPSLLTSASFAKGFLRNADDEHRLSFVKYAWREAAEEGLKNEDPRGNVTLWRVMKRAHPTQFPGDYPNTPEARTAVHEHFPAKQELEERWCKENVPDFWEKLENFPDDNIIPIVLVRLILGYADPKPTWLDV